MKRLQRFQVLFLFFTVKLPSVSVVLICVILAAVCAAFSVMPAVGMLRPAYLIPIATGALGGIFGANIKK